MKEVFDKEMFKKLLNNKIINKHIQNLQNIVNKDNGITSMSISCGDSKVEFKKGK